MTRTQLNVAIPVATADQLRALATDVGVPIGDLADLLLRVGAAKVGNEGLRKWAATVPSRLGRTGGGLRASERAAVAQLERAHAATLGDPWAPARVFGLVEIARGAGLLLRDAHDALQGLALRGLVGSARSAEVDRWGRPVESVWWLAANAPSACDQREVLEAVRALRAEIALTTVEAGARAMMRIELRRVAGWSEAACALPEGLETAEGQAPAVPVSAWRPWFEARVQLTR